MEPFPDFDEAACISQEFFDLIVAAKFADLKIEAEDSEEFDQSDLGRRYRTMEAASMRLQKEAKGYLDSLRGTYCRFWLWCIADHI
jgi:hypothetical protein